MSTTWCVPGRTPDVVPEPMRGPLSGWRVDHVTDDGVLVAPVARRYWHELQRPEDVWQPGLNLARCLSHDHRAPDRGCACGIRALTSFQEVIQPFVVNDGALADDLDLGALSRVRVQGLLLPGVDMPDEDPATAVRAAAATLLEVNLTPSRAHLLDLVQERHPEATVYACEGEGWLEQVDPLPGFWEDVQAAGFGRLNTAHPDVQRVLLKLAAEVPRFLLDGITTPSDCARMVFDVGSGVTVGQAQHFVAAVIEYLAPEFAGTQDPGVVVAKPIGAAESRARQMGLNPDTPALTAALAGPQLSRLTR